MPLAAALIGAPAGKAILMPSLRSPLLLEPKPAITLPLAGQTKNSLTLPSITLASAGTYSVAVNGFCNGVTNSATLTVAAGTAEQAKIGAETGLSSVVIAAI